MPPLTAPVDSISTLGGVDLGLVHAVFEPAMRTPIPLVDVDLRCTLVEDLPHWKLRVEHVVPVRRRRLVPSWSQSLSRGQVPHVPRWQRLRRRTRAQLRRLRRLRVHVDE